MDVLGSVASLGQLGAAQNLLLPSWPRPPLPNLIDSGLAPALFGASSFGIRRGRFPVRVRFSTSHPRIKYGRERQNPPLGHQTDSFFRLRITGQFPRKLRTSFREMALGPCTVLADFSAPFATDFRPGPEAVTEGRVLDDAFHCLLRILPGGGGGRVRYLMGAFLHLRRQIPGAVVERRSSEQRLLFAFRH